MEKDSNKTGESDALEPLIAARRHHVGAEKPIQSERWGLALSGGGVRSATFCYGLVTALAKTDVFRRFDLMSTVSGGGYIGSMIGRLAQSKKTAEELQDTLAEPGKTSKERRWLRANSRYLIPRGSRDWLFAVVTFLRNLAAIHIELGVVALGVGCILGLIDIAAWWLFDLALINSSGATNQYLEVGWSFVSSLPTLWLFAPIPAAFAVTAAFRYWYLPPQSDVAASDAQRHQVTDALATWLRWTVALVALGCVDWIAWRIANRPQQLLVLGPSFAALLAVLRVLLPLVQGASQGGSNAAILRLPVLVDFAGRIGLIVLLVFWTSVAHALFTRQVWDTQASQVDYVAAVDAVLGALVAVGGWAWVSGRTIEFLNRSSLHHFYRSRLTRTYLGAANAARDTGSKVTEPEHEDDVLFSKYAPQATGGPVHLLNVCLNQTYQHSGLFNIDRQGQLMTVVGPGLVRFEQSSWEVLPASMETLGTWMAVSGAAAAPGLGSATRPGWAAMLTALGIRLGYWRDGGSENKRCNWIARHFPKYNYLLCELFAHLPGNNERVQYLSDGGHSENTGAYPLLASGCQLIVLADCGADPLYRFDDLENLIRRARVDLGVDIRFVTPDPSMPALGTLNDVAAPDKNACLAAATILYPTGDTGMLILVKPNIASDLPEDVYNYSRDNPSFPQQTTADQIFGEDQWESYYALGEHIGSSLTSNLINKVLANRTAVPAKEPQTPAATQAVAASKRRAPPRIGVPTAAGATLGLGAILTSLGGLWTAFQHGTPPDKEFSSRAMQPLYESYAALNVGDERQNSAAVGRMAAQLMVVWRSAREDHQDVNLASNKEAIDMLRTTVTQCYPQRDRLSACRSLLTVFTCPQVPRKLSPVEENVGYWARHEFNVDRREGVNYCDEVIQSIEAANYDASASAGVAVAAAPLPASGATVTSTASEVSSGVEPSIVAASGPANVQVGASQSSAASTVGATQTQSASASAPATSPNVATLEDPKPCAKVTVYVQIYGADGRDNVRSLRSLWQEAGASVPSIEDVNESARRQGRNPPTPFTRPTAIFHDSVAKICAASLAKRAYQDLDSWDLVPLKSTLTPTPRTVEVWLPPSAVKAGFDQWIDVRAWCYQEYSPAGEGVPAYGVHCHPTKVACESAKGPNLKRTQSECIKVADATLRSTLVDRGWAGSRYKTSATKFGPPFPSVDVP